MAHTRALAQAPGTKRHKGEEQKETRAIDDDERKSDDSHRDPQPDAAADSWEADRDNDDDSGSDDDDDDDAVPSSKRRSRSRSLDEEGVPVASSGTVARLRDKFESLAHALKTHPALKPVVDAAVQRRNALAQALADDEEPAAAQAQRSATPPAAGRTELLTGRPVLEENKLASNKKEEAFGLLLAAADSRSSEMMNISSELDDSRPHEQQSVAVVFMSPAPCAHTYRLQKVRLGGVGGGRLLIYHWFAHHPSPLCGS